MGQTIGHIAILVRDYDEAIAFFTKCLDFQLVEDTCLQDGKRWVLVAPPGVVGTALLLARAGTPDQLASVGKQTAGQVFLFPYTDNLWRDYQKMQSRGVAFEESHGKRPTAPSWCSVTSMETAGTLSNPRRRAARQGAAANGQQRVPTGLW